MKKSTLDEISAAYNQFAFSYEEEMKKPYQIFYRERIKGILRSYISKNSKVLDIGCGTGFPSIFLATEMNCKVYGIDISEEMINILKRNIREDMKTKLNLKLLPVQKLQLLEERNFDYVTSIYGPLNYVEDLESILKEVQSRLREKGYFIASFYSKYSCARLRNIEHLRALSENNVELYPHYVGNKNMNIRLYDADELLTIFKKYFSVVDIEGIGFIPFMLLLEDSEELIVNLEYYLSLEKILAKRKPFVDLGMDILLVGEVIK